jgi:hypothetical protein
VGGSGGRIAGWDLCVLLAQGVCHALPIGGLLVKQDKAHSSFYCPRRPCCLTEVAPRAVSWRRLTLSIVSLVLTRVPGWKAAEGHSPGSTAGGGSKWESVFFNQMDGHMPHEAMPGTLVRAFQGCNYSLFLPVFPLSP